MKKNEDKYLVVTCEDKQYGIPVHNVKHITDTAGMTLIPTAAKSIKGFVNLKGKVVTVMDLRVKLGKQDKPYTGRSYLVVIKFNLDHVNKEIGIAVDSVLGVESAGGAEIGFLPEDAVAGSGFITQAMQAEDKSIMVINIEKMLNNEELSILKQT